jgi:non-specific serine/threonine protein kinase
MANIAGVQGDLAQAAARTQEGLALARELGDKSLIALALQNLGYLASLQDDLPRAVARTQEGLALARELGDKISINLALHNLGYISSRQGDIKQAAKWYGEGLSHAQEIGDEAQIGWHLIGLASVAAEEGKPRRAACLFGAAEMRLDINVSMNAVEQAEYTRTVEGVRGKLGEQAFTSAWAEGRTQTPEQALEASEQASEQVSASISLPRAPVHPDGLTAREVEVLNLLAQGLTNKQIATRLVISLRTVTTHLSSIYSKTGVNTRAAATRYAIQHGLV